MKTFKVIQPSLLVELMPQQVYTYEDDAVGGVHIQNTKGTTPRRFIPTDIFMNLFRYDVIEHCEDIVEQPITKYKLGTVVVTTEDTPVPYRYVDIYINCPIQGKHHQYLELPTEDAKRLCDAMQ